jgi:hypothetical protein
MDTHWKQVKCITLRSVNTLEDFTTRLEDLIDSETTLSQTVVTNLESVMLKAGYDEDLARERAPMSIFYGISLLGFQYFVYLQTHLWKVDTTKSGSMQSCIWSNMLNRCVKYANLMGPAYKWSV